MSNRSNGEPEEILAKRRALAMSRIAETKRIIENCQHELDRAARNLSPLIGAIPLWNAAGKLSNGCRDLWDRLDKAERSGRVGPRFVEIDGKAEELDQREAVER